MLTKHLLLCCSDDPLKCDMYAFGTQRREMFACRVLLGDIKVGLLIDE